MNTTDAMEILTAEDVSKILKISKTTLIENVIKKNSIPYRKIGRLYRFRKEDVINFMKGEHNEKNTL